MSTLEQTKSTLEAIRADLKNEKEALLTLLKDPRIADWHSLDLKRHKALLVGIGLDPDLISEALVEYPKQAKRIAKQLSEWDNEIGNQLADLIGQPDTESAQAKARGLEEKCRGLIAMKEQLLVCTHQFMMADQVLRRQLELKSMLIVAKVLAVGRRELFESGITILSLLVPAIDGAVGGMTLQEMRQEPARLEERFKRLDVTKLPRLVEEVLFHYIEEAVASSKEISLFLGTLNDRMVREVEAIDAIEQALAVLHPEGPAGLVNGITKQAGQVGTLLSALHHKRQIKETMSTVNEALDSLHIFLLLLKNRIIPDLQREVGHHGGALSPGALAAKMTRSFFMGAKGIIRSLKLMITSLTGQPAINEHELQLTLERAIMNCKTFYGKSRDDLKKMKYYIDSLVGQYPKPFPYNDLFKLTRTTLSAYGDEVEKFIHNLDIPKEMQGMAKIEVPAKVGKLYASISRYKTLFQKANAET